VKRLQWLLLMAAFLVTGTACSGDDDDATGPGNGGGLATGELSFNYSGALSGRFEAEGGLTGTSSPGDEYAVGMVDANENAMGVSAFVPTGSNRGDKVVIVIPGASRPGTYTISDDCGDCPGFLLYFGLPTNQQADPASTRIFVAIEGQISVSRVDDGRMVGTFSGKAIEVLGDDEGMLDVTSGSFNVPVVELPIPDPGLGLAPVF